MAEGERVGQVVHFFDKISVAVAELDSGLQIGDKVHFEGPHTDFEQEIGSMQIEHEVVTKVKAGDEVAIKVDEPVRKGDTIHRT